MECWRNFRPRDLLMSSNRMAPSPLKLIVVLFAWIVPYLLFANYLERSLFPLRLMCYTQSDLLSVEKLDNDFDKCVSRFFPDSHADPNCQLNKAPAVLIRPKLPENLTRLVVIRTGPGSTNYRNFIRETWKSRVDPFAPVVFVCASTGRDVVEEAEKYEDILQFEFADSYHNLSWKMMAIYGFVLNEIPTAEEIIVINDDTIVNATALQNIPRVASNGAWMMGKVSRGYPRLFMPWLPWHVPGEMYPNLCYPRFTQGSSFILSREGAKLLLDNVCKVPFVHLDDIFVGIISNCVGVQQHHHPGFDKHVFEDFVVYHYQYSRHSPEHLRKLWQSSPGLH